MYQNVAIFYDFLFVYFKRDVFSNTTNYLKPNMFTDLSLFCMNILFEDIKCVKHSMNEWFTQNFMNVSLALSEYLKLFLHSHQLCIFSGLSIASCMKQSELKFKKVFNSVCCNRPKVLYLQCSKCDLFLKTLAKATNFFHNFLKSQFWPF